MRKFIRIVLITLGSLLLIGIISLSVAMWLIFTPERITPILRNQTEKHLPYPTEIGEADLTFFSTFPQFGIKLDKFTVLSPAKDAISDTLLNIEQLTGVIDAQQFWKNRNLIVKELILTKGSVNVFTDSLGVSNYDLFISGSSDETEEEEAGDISFIDLDNISLNDINLSYSDLAEGINSSVRNLKASFSGSLNEDLVDVVFTLDESDVSFFYKDEKYLEHASLKIKLPARISLARQLIELEQAFFSVNGLGINLNGSLENELEKENLIADLDYELDSWNIQEVMSLIPLKYLSGTGLNSISGKISSTGKIAGLYNDSLMPVMDIALSLNNVQIDYQEIPFPLSGINGDIHFFGDMNNEEPSWLRIDHFEAKTPRSDFKTSGHINHIFSDMHCDLITDADAFLDEFADFLPDDMKLKGRIKGEIETDFLLSQLTNMELDKVKVSGLTSLYDFSVNYDSLSVLTNYSRIEFSLPATNALNPNTTFASLTIDSDKFSASQIASFNTSMDKSRIYLEMSDVRDTTRIPDLFCTYRMNSLQAEMDTIHLSMLKPYGNVLLSPVEGSPGLPAMEVAFSTFDLRAKAGNNSVEIEDILLNTNVSNDTTQEDVFLQWPAIGSLDLKNGSVSLETLTETINIPSLEMNFDPETFNIHESRLTIDRSDYELKGALNNVLSYFRGDSILRGDFNFFSNTTDLNQLMALTSGIGTESVPEDTIQNAIVNANSSLPESEDSLSMPYMVPEGIEFNLSARVNQLISGADTAVNINGDVLINDGILVLDELNFTTPAAEMQLTAMYRTPRKNHLYLGIDYHMLDVEISRLLQMIPDIDTIMPMLRSFSGSGEFHIAAETYLDSAYNIKMSTLRGASSIAGNDLVLLDGETFSEIAKKLRFSRKAENKVDSLSAEFTIFREEIDIYPFLIVMDRYKAVVGGRHNLDMSFNYHISLVESPLPVRLGIDINGNLEDLHYKPVAPRYAEFYRPASRKAVQSTQLELRRLIREALIGKVEKTDEQENDE